MSRSLAAVSLGFLLLACNPEFIPSKEAQVLCTLDAECPAGWKCHPSLRRCTPSEDLVEDLPRPVLVFSSPSNGREAVPTEEPLTLVFSMDLAPASLEGRVHLRREEPPADVPLRRESASLGSTYQFTPLEPLGSLAQYELTVSAGLEPAPGLYATVSDATYSIRFTTADTLPPAPPTELVVDQTQTVRLRWKPPSDPDYAGVLVLRRTGAPVAVAPTRGVVYSIGTCLEPDPGGGACRTEVIAATVKQEWTDLSPPAGPSGYAVFALDRNANYSAPIRPPFLRDWLLAWCTDERGTFTMLSDQGGWQQLQVSHEPLTAYEEATGQFSARGDLGATMALPGPETLELRVRHFLRPIVGNAQARFIGPDREFTPSPWQLTPAGAPPGVPPGTPATFAFTRHGWSGFEAQFDRDGGTGEDWQPLTVEAGAGRVTAVVPNAVGESYRFRVRPVAPGCPQAPWTTSSALKAGAFRFVSSAGEGDGSSAAQPAPTITKGIEDAAEGTTVLVAGGTYPEQVTMKYGVSLLGGWDPAFALRDPALYPTVVSPDVTTVQNDAAVIVTQALGGPTVEFSGFRVQPTGLSAASTRGMSISAGPLLLRDNLIEGGSGTESVAVLVAGASAVRIERCQLSAGTGSTRRGLFISLGNGVEVVGNSIVGSQVLWVGSANNVRIEGNALRADGLPSGQDVHGFYCSWGSNNTFRNNTIDLGALSGTEVAVGGWLFHCPADVDSNQIRLGEGRVGIGLLADLSDARIVNNLIHPGRASARVTGVESAGSKATISHNTVYSGEGRGSTAQQQAIALRSSSGTPSTARLTNNLLFGSGAWTAFGNTSTSGDTEPLVDSLQNNVVVGLPASLWRQGGWDHASFDTLQPQLVNAGRVAGSNQVLDVALEQALADPTGADGLLGTLDDDWRPLHSALKSGGKDASASTCGPTAAESCGAVTTDIVSTPRTAPTSVGAYEVP